MESQRIDLVVFSDDWGRHPSSCQHLVRALLDGAGGCDYRVTWVNTIGTRMPTLSVGDLGKVVRKLRQWSSPSEADVQLPERLKVVSPRMWPGFRRGWQKNYNAKSISNAVNAALGPRSASDPKRVAVTTIPIVADVVGRIDVDRWVYYCVDDFALWPGLDANVMRDMERDLIQRVDAHVAVSDHLVEHIDGVLRDASSATPDKPSLLTHGIDLEHWQQVASGPQTGQAEPSGDKPLASSPPDWAVDADKPIILFWGLIDRRLDVDWLAALDADLSQGSIVLVGPQQDPDPAVERLGRVTMPGPAAYAELPAIARHAAVLIMPYADLPVTRAMNPLKFKEYLATGLPVVARRLPATVEWTDAADLLETADDFVTAVRERIDQGLPPAQQAVRDGRLPDEAWRTKAACFESLLVGGGG